MGKKKKQTRDEAQILLERLSGRKVPRHLRSRFESAPRGLHCLNKYCGNYMYVERLDYVMIRNQLNSKCPTIEHQMIAIRKLTHLTQEKFNIRLSFVKEFLNCLLQHHDTVYEGTVFGSSINGLGFIDSDVDLRLNPMKFYKDCELLEPMPYNGQEIENTLRNIANQTTICNPCFGEYVPSSRCPVAKLTFYTGNARSKYRTKEQVKSLKKGVSCDVSMLTGNTLVGLNSKLIRFYCFFDPKFHILAYVVKYWAHIHELIKPGQLSSYALINMLIFFCQQLNDPLIPTVNNMRDKYFQNLKQSENAKLAKALVKIEWNCLVCFQKGYYQGFGKNKELISILLLKFYEFLMNFNYSKHIISIASGKHMTIDEYQASDSYHSSFPIKGFINIQDPFDHTHNLTAGMEQKHFEYMIDIISHSYEKLFLELLNNFDRPDCSKTVRDWGLTTILQEFPI